MALKVDEIKMLDITAPEQVDITINTVNGKYVIWVNVDGFCRLRISQNQLIEVNLPTDFKVKYF